MLSKKQIEKVCERFQGASECRYLDVGVGNNYNKCCCLKLVAKQKADIDARVKKHLEQCKKNNQDPKQMGVAIGDNCPGYPYLKFVKQGYDVTP